MRSCYAINFDVEENAKERLNPRKVIHQVPSTDIRGFQVDNCDFTNFEELSLLPGYLVPINYCLFLEVSSSNLQNLGYFGKDWVRGPVLSNWNPLIYIPTAVEAHSFSKKAPKRNRYIPQSNDLQSSSIYKLVSVLEFWSTKFLIFMIW